MRSGTTIKLGFPALFTLLWPSNGNGRGRYAVKDVYGRFPSDLQLKSDLMIQSKKTRHILPYLQWPGCALDYLLICLRTGYWIKHLPTYYISYGRSLNSFIPIGCLLEPYAQQLRKAAVSRRIQLLWRRILFDFGKNSNNMSDKKKEGRACCGLLNDLIYPVTQSAT